MTIRPQILCISFSDIRRDARVLRQLAVLREHGDITTLGYGSPPDGVVEHLEIPSGLASLPQTALGVALLATRRFRAVEMKAPAVAKGRRLVGNRKFDLIVANEARALPLAHSIAQGAPIWGDMHEWAPGERTHVLSWRLLVAPYMKWVCATYLPVTTAVTTVNTSIADLFDRSFGIRTELVRNARPLENLKPSPTLANRIRLVHSGGAVPGRNIEALISATLELDERFSLDLYLIEARGCHAYLQSLHSMGAASPRITFHEAVSPEALPVTLNAYDVGVYLLPPVTLNHRYMLPNKFFDYIQARLAIVFGPAVEIDRLTTTYDLGLITTGYEQSDLVTALSHLTPAVVERYKKNADTAAAHLSSIQDVSTEHAIIRRLLRDAK